MRNCMAISNICSYECKDNGRHKQIQHFKKEVGPVGISDNVFLCAFFGQPKCYFMAIFLYFAIYLYIYLPFLGDIIHSWGDDTVVPSDTGFLTRIFSSFLVLLNIFCPKQSRKHDLTLDILSGIGKQKEAGKKAECSQ